MTLILLTQRFTEYQVPIEGRKQVISSKTVKKILVGALHDTCPNEEALQQTTMHISAMMDQVCGYCTFVLIQ